MAGDGATDSNPPVIALDGPSGAGKGTVAQRLARILKWHLLDSGALYRIVGLSALKQGLPTDAGDELAAMTQKLAIAFEPAADGVQVLVDGEDVTAAIRTDAISKAASEVAQHDAVRAALLAVQRGLRRPPGLIADGRDMGSVVFIDAPLKIYLDATVEERARRRYNQLKDKGLGGNVPGLFDGTLETVKTSIAERDERDMNRSVSPLVQAEDALYVDSTHLSIDQVVDEVIKLAELRNLSAG